MARSFNYFGSHPPEDSISCTFFEETSWVHRVVSLIMPGPFTVWRSCNLVRYLKEFNNFVIRNLAKLEVDIQSDRIFLSLLS